MRQLILIRHGQSEWNLKNLFTGWHDVGLTPTGVEEAKRAALTLKGLNIHIDKAYTSSLTRAQHTCQLLLEGMGLSSIETIQNQALNERDYGDLTGLNKDDARQKWGEEQVHIWRRSYDVAPPNGESLRDSVARVLPYFVQTILPEVMQEQSILVAAHGNSLRALMMVLDRLSPEDITDVNLATAVPVLYRLNADTSVHSKAVIE